MENDLTRLSLLAIDIADPEIRSLQETYEQIEKSMVKAGIPAERMRLIAQSVKFPTAEAMFDFINQKYGEYLIGEGAKLETFTLGCKQRWLFHQWQAAQAEEEP